VRAYPAAEITRLYARRWDAETNFRHMKQTLNLDHPRSRTADGAAGEQVVLSPAHYLVRAAMGLAARVLGDDPLRVSFADALNLPLGQANLDLGHATVNAERPGQHEPRRLKRQNKNYLPLDGPGAEAKRKAA
jgi:IS4 transposase